MNYNETIKNTKSAYAVYLKSWFEPYGTQKFEGIDVRVPAMSRKVLNEVYGDWAWPHGAMSCYPTLWFFDTERGYEYYVRKYRSAKGFDDADVIGEYPPPPDENGDEDE